MAYKAIVKADSVSEEKVRLLTYETEFPRFILPEVLTHRKFTRNTASSRAIPVKRIVQQIQDDPAMPVYWGRNRAGMSAGEETDDLLFFRDYKKNIVQIGNMEIIPGSAIRQLLDTETHFSREEAWLLQRDRAIEIAEAFSKAEYHKQIVNRLLEPWVHTQMVISSTFWRNFFNLRIADDAQPEIKVLAEKIYHAGIQSKPRLLRHGQWHLPYVTAGETYLSTETLRKYSAARIARASYNNHDGTAPNHETDIRTFGKLIPEKGSLHGSPLEHQATPIPGHHATNFYGWMQFRELLDKQPLVEYYYGELAQ